MPSKPGHSQEASPGTVVSRSAVHAWPAGVSDPENQNTVPVGLGVCGSPWSELLLAESLRPQDQAQPELHLEASGVLGCGHTATHLPKRSKHTKIPNTKLGLIGGTLLPRGIPQTLMSLYIPVYPKRTPT